MLSRFRVARRTAAAALLAPALAAGQAHNADEIVVTGILRDGAVGDIGQPVTVIRDETLDRARSANLGETLAGQIGVSSSAFGAGASRPIIRGLGGARVRMLEDGIDAMDAASVSDDHAVSIDPLVAEQIEIFRGPTTLLYGSGAVGGVVNTVTTRIPEAAPEEGFGGAFELRGETAANERAAGVRLDGGGNAFAWHFDALARDGDDYEIPSPAELDEPGAIAGVLENSAVDSEAAALGGSWLGERGFLGLAVSTFDTLYGIPGRRHHAEEGHDGAEPALSAAAEERERVRIDLAQTRVDLKGGWASLRGPIEGVNLRLATNDYEHVELEGEERGTLFTSDAYEGRVELLHRPFGAWSGAVGVQVSERKFAAIGEEAFVPPVDTTAYGVFAVEELELSSWRLSFGGRLETQEQRPSNGVGPVDGNAASLSFAAVREFADGYSLALNLARSERLPEAEELFSDGPHLATGAVQIGSGKLREETSRHVDVGLRKTSDVGTAWSVTAFTTRYDDFIYLQDTGGVDAEHDLPIFTFVQAGAQFTGIEAELFMPLAEVADGELDMRWFADYVHGELESGGDLPRMPPLRYGARFQYHDERMTAGIEAAQYDDQHDIAAFETPTEGYLMLNADFVWRFATRDGLELDFFVNGSNLADADARMHTSFVKDVAPLPGRNYSLGVRSRF